ncbi:hypothetical protein C0991_003006, partial [Blastosporella zonata]
MPRPPSRGGSAILTPTGTLNMAQAPLICTNALSAITTSPICSTNDAQKYLDKNRWVLLGELYSRSKLTHIIATMVLGDTLTLLTTGDALKPDIRNTLLSVAFLINSDITDHISDALTKAIASKTEASLSKLENATSRLADSPSPAPLLGPPPSPPPHEETPPPGQTRSGPTSRLPPPGTSTQRPTSAIPGFSNEINFLKSDDTVPTDHSPNGLATLRESINQKLATIDSHNAAKSLDHPDSPPPKTLVRGITATNKGAFILKLDTAESVQRFTKYTNDTSLSFPSGILGSSATISNRPHCVIAKFVPCDGAFDPDDNDHLCQIEYDNFLPEHSITTAHWLKQAVHQSPSQATATIKLICSSATTANRMINEWIFISGKKVVIHKDIRAPLHCNKCQMDSHLHANCKGTKK